MTKSLSGYLNLLRVLAAVAVFTGHLAAAFPAASAVARAMVFLSFAHDGVVIFFALSGFLIAYAAFEREKSGAAYVSARFTRLASVVIPALALSLAVNAVLIHMPGGRGLPWKPYDPLIALTFLTQSGNQFYMLFYDPPFWSLNYEVWYYVIFGLAVFAPGGFWKIFGAFLAAIIAGPNIMMLSPVWLMGVAAYFLHRRMTLPYARAAFFATILVYASCKCVPAYVLAANWAEPFEARMPFTFYATNGFLWDWLVGLLTAVNILAFRGMNLRPFPTAFGSYISYAAGVTFSVYLYHVPIVYVVLTIAEHYTSPMAAPVLAGVITLGLCVALAHVTEHQRGRIMPLLLAMRGCARHLSAPVRARGRQI